MAKAYSKSEKRRRKRVRATERPQESVKAASAVTTTETPEKRTHARAERPTPERLARGVWKIPRGQGRQDLPALDMAEDMLGLLLHDGKITGAQEQAGRTWQARRLAYEAELPDVSGYRSCLSPDVPGYDDGDGNPDIIEEYRRIERALGRAGRIEIMRVCWEQQRPRSIDILRWALDVVERC